MRLTTKQLDAIRRIGKESRHLETTDRRLFAAAMTPVRAASLSFLRAANAMVGEVVARGWGE